MLKLVIADDEKIIRETIRNFIDWQSIGIEVVGVCSNAVSYTHLSMIPSIFFILHYPLIPDVAMPSTKYFCSVMKIMTAGSRDSVAIANIAP